MSSLRIESLCFKENGPINLIVEPSQCIGISGPSGAGKTLMLRALVDLDPLDPENVARVEKLITDYRTHNNSPVIWVSHSLAQIRRIADKCYLMHQGNLIEQG